VRCFFYAIRVQKAGTIMDDAQKEELTKVVDLPFWGRAHYFVKFALPAQIEAYFRWTFAENDQIRVVGWSFYDSTGSGTDYGLHIPQLGRISVYQKWTTWLLALFGGQQRMSISSYTNSSTVVERSPSLK
jgi:hypothetical protein